MSGSSKSTLTRRSRPSPDTARTIPPPNLRWRTRSPFMYRGASCETASGNPMSGSRRAAAPRGRDGRGGIAPDPRSGRHDGVVLRSSTTCGGSAWRKRDGSASSSRPLRYRVRAHETHVTESSLFFDATRLFGRATERKQSILQTRERDDWPLESLGHVRGEERDSGLVLILVHRRDQSSLGEVALDGSAGALGRVGILHLRPRGGAGDQLANFLDPLHPLGGFVGQILLVAGRREDGLERGGRVRLSHRFPQTIEQGCHAGERLPHVGAQVVHAAGAARRLEQRLLPPRRRPAKQREGGVADAAAGDVDDPEKRLVVGRIGDQPQVPEEVFHLATFVKTDRPDQAVGNTAKPKRLFERTGLRVGTV